MNTFVQVPRGSVCATCNDSGKYLGALCPTCHGSTDVLKTPKQIYDDVFRETYLRLCDERRESGTVLSQRVQEESHEAALCAVIESVRKYEKQK